MASKYSCGASNEEVTLTLMFSGRSAVIFYKI